MTECPNANYGFHVSLVNGKETPDADDFAAVAAEAGLTRSQAADIIREMKTIINNSKIRTEFAAASSEIPVKKRMKF